MADPQGRPPPLGFSEFLDWALLGSIALLMGNFLVRRFTAGGTTTGDGSIPLTDVTTLGRALTGGPELIGFLIAAVGALMMLAGPLWYLIGRPLFRRGYL